MSRIDDENPAIPRQQAPERRWPDPIIEIEWLGGCAPTQGEGTIDGKAFYFRARGDGWRLEVYDGSPDDEPSWVHHQPYGNHYDASWMDVTEAEAFIRAAARNWAAGWRPGQPEDHPEVRAASGK